VASEDRPRCNHRCDCGYHGPRQYPVKPTRFLLSESRLPVRAASFAKSFGSAKEGHFSKVALDFFRDALAAARSGAALTGAEVADTEVSSPETWPSG
jgi:hypothetical protein